MVVRERLLTDYRDRTGPFDVIGDVHGCRTELEALLGQLGYNVTRDEGAGPSTRSPPDGRTALFLGDLVDRGPDSPGVLRLVMGMVAAGHAQAVPGNHENKLTRALPGGRSRSVTGWGRRSASWPARTRRSARRSPGSATAWSRIWCWTAAGWWWLMPA